MTEPILTRDEALSPSWMKVRAHAEAELTRWRLALEGEKTEVETAKIRGRIAQLRNLLALAPED